MNTNDLEAAAGYRFVSKKLLRTALSHSSFINETKSGTSNERLEFFGDSILSLITSNYLYNNLAKLPEGELTKIRAAVVCEKSLCVFARKIGLGRYLLLGRGEDNSGGRERDSILADAFEAFLAAVYLDGGMQSAEDFLLPFIKDGIEDALRGGHRFTDYKTKLQEIVQKNKEETLTYNLISERGPDHDKEFKVQVLLNSNAIGEGTGRTKKEAEQQAAKSALEYMGE